MAESGERRVGRHSKNPHAIRKRIRASKARFDSDLDDLNEALGYKPIEEWSLDELAKGRPQLPDGTWKRGKVPEWITPRIMGEIKRRFREEALNSLGEHITPAIAVISELITSQEVDHTGKPVVDARTRLDAAKFVIEHVIGKAKQAVELNTDETYRQFLAGALVLPGGNSAHPVVDGHLIGVGVVEDEEDSDDGE